MGLSLASMAIEMAAYFKVEREFEQLMWSRLRLAGAAVELSSSCSVCDYSTVKNHRRSVGGGFAVYEKSCVPKR